MNSRFPLLSTVTVIMSAVGILTVVAGLLLIVFEIPGLGFMRFVIGSLAVVIGLGTVALGESIGVLFAIEANTRATAEGARPVYEQSSTGVKGKAELTAEEKEKLKENPFLCYECGTRLFGTRNSMGSCPYCKAQFTI